jgi:hypothetical protein
MLTGESKVERLLQDLKAILEKRETVLIFTQYSDTMDFLRDQLREVYGAQVACYSGRGGERWDGTRWAQTTKEIIKQLFLKGQDIKILIGTEAASEGLNLQTCGVLINFDVPWNPMRVEQRIGRIDRIGQTHKKVWIRNYFYEESVEATIYRRLEDRITWFETVVGELQPILARIATAIRDLAMSKGAERARRMEDVLRELREQLQAREVAGLDIDRYLEETVTLPRERKPPVSLADLEVLFLKSRVHGGRFKPHPTIGGAYVLSWRGEEVGITFDPAVFDQHPSSLRLLSFGDEIFAALLEGVAAPIPTADAGRVIRCAAEANGCHRAYFSDVGGDLVGVENFGALRAAVEGPTPASATSQDCEAARSRLVARCMDAGRRAREAEEARRRTTLSTLEEEGRQLLLKAALIELAIARLRELWDEPSAVEFSEETIRGLRQKGYPFAPLLRLVNVEGLRPAPTDPFFLRIQGESREALGRCLAAVSARMKDLVEQLEKARRAVEDSRGAEEKLDATVSVTLYQ